MTIEPHFTNIRLIARETGINENQIEYLPSESYPCGMHNCCYHMVYRTLSGVIPENGMETEPEGLFAVEYHCGCERQTVPDGSLQSLYVSKL